MTKPGPKPGQEAGGMLDPWIIEEIRRKEEEQRKNQRPVAHIDTPAERPPDSRAPSKDKDGDRGITIIGDSDSNFGVFK